jgi:SAM-dependent methyltransferase
MNAVATTDLRALYDAHSKHSSYQLIHPSLLPLLGDAAGLPAGKHEAQRQRWFERGVRFADASVLDIGANTGYFSFAALGQGARRVVSQEGNVRHAEFIEAAARRLGLAERLEARPSYFDFAAAPRERFDICLCLNVLHHLGDDFGDPAVTIGEARHLMLAGINGLAASSKTLLLQLGFNWKGDVRFPLFEGGTKQAVIDFVRAGTASHWQIDEIVVVDTVSRDYVPAEAHQLARVDGLGEFLNRPLFRMTVRS